MAESKLKKLADLKVVAGEYERDGKTRRRYQTVGALFGTPHHSRLAIKLYPTATNGERWLNVYYDEGCDPSWDREAKPSNLASDQAQTVDQTEPVNIEDIQF